MNRIIHPRPEIGRTTDFDIEFIDGVGERDLTDAPNLTAALIQHGVTIEADLDYLADWTREADRVRRRAGHRPRHGKDEAADPSGNQCAVARGDR